MLLIFDSHTLDFREPNDYTISPVTKTNTRRALDGTVWSTLINLNDVVELQWNLVGRYEAAVLTTALYENTGKTFQVQSRYFGATLFFRENSLPIVGDRQISLSLSFEIIDYRPVT